MANSILDEQQIQADVDRLRKQFPKTSELYREVSMLLFFRYGITPTANKLYQYVKKGSMSAPASALKKFWLELREKSRIRIEHPDLPENLQAAAGEVIGALWNEARTAAAINYEALNLEADEKIRLAELRAIELESQLAQMQAELSNKHENLKTALQAIREHEKNHAVDISTLLTLEKSLETLKKEKLQLQEALERTRIGFSEDVDKMNQALSKAEDRYRALEVRSLLEIDKERQSAFQAESELKFIRQEMQRQETKHKRDMAKIDASNKKSREIQGELKGQLSMSLALRKQQDKEMKQLFIKLKRMEIAR